MTKKWIGTQSCFDLWLDLVSLQDLELELDSLQVPVAELLARPAPTLHSPSVHAKKSSNFLQVPEIESPR